MNQPLSWLIEGVPFGCVYALVAIGIVLTFKTTGIFNFAFAAQAFIAAAVYVKLVEINGYSSWFGFIVAVAVVSPLLGVLFERGLFRGLRVADWRAKLIVVLGLFVALPELTEDTLTGRQPVPVTARSSVPRMLGITSPGFRFAGHFVAWDFIVAAAATFLIVALLGLFFRYTALGLQMRAVVESPRMVELAGVNADRVGSLCWALSSTVAGLAGVVLATLAQALDVTTFMLIILVCTAAAVVGRLRSLPVTLAAGIAFGVLDRALPDVLYDRLGLSLRGTLAVDLRPILPFLVVFLFLVLVPSMRRAETVDPLVMVDPPPPAPARLLRTPVQRRRARLGTSVVACVAVVLVLTAVSGLWALRLSNAMALATVFLSITVITGLGGQISLAQATFAGFGGFTAANLATGRGLPMFTQVFPGFLVGWHAPVLLGVAVGAVIAAAIGALVALPSRRLDGIYLTLASLAFALMVETVLFNRFDLASFMPRPSLASSDRSFFLLTVVAFGVLALAVVLIRRGTTGKFLAALRGSEVAAASIGISPTAMRVRAFALSGAVAGVGGALVGMVGRLVLGGQVGTFPTTIGITWVVLVLVLGADTVDGALSAGIAFIVLRWLLEDALRLPTGTFIAIFGLAAISYARHPEGLVTFGARQFTAARFLARRLRARATTLQRSGESTGAYQPIARVVLPVAAGPGLYLVYLLARSVTDGHWAAAHTGTLLVFIVPSVLALLIWTMRADVTLRRRGENPFGTAVMAAGAVAGAVAALGLHALGDLPGSAVGCAAIGLAVGGQTVMFCWLPNQAHRIAVRRGDLATPFSWREGLMPVLGVAGGVYTYSRLQTSTPPSGWPVCVAISILILIWLQWAARVAGALNEIAVGRLRDDSLETQAANVADSRTGRRDA